MKTICLYFEIHQIIHLKRYRFFDITMRTSVASPILLSVAICLR